MIVLALAISGFAVVMLARNSTTVLLVGILLLFLGAIGGLLLGLSALWRLRKETTTLLREDGPALMSEADTRATWRKIALHSLLGALITPLIVVSSVDDPQMPLGVKVSAGVVLGAFLGPLLYYVTPGSP